MVAWYTTVIVNCGVWANTLGFYHTCGYGVVTGVVCEKKPRCDPCYTLSAWCSLSCCLHGNLLLHNLYVASLMLLYYSHQQYCEIISPPCSAAFGVFLECWSAREHPPRWRRLCFHKMFWGLFRELEWILRYVIETCASGPLLRMACPSSLGESKRGICNNVTWCMITPVHPFLGRTS